MIRQFELVERVKSYDPNADEDLLNRAYVFSMKAHGSQEPRLRRSLFSPSARSRRYPHPAEAGLRLDRHRAAARYGRGYQRHPRQIERSFGKDIARLVDGVTKLSRLELQSDQSQAGRELPQARAGDVGGYPRPAGEAGRPPAQHADAGTHQEPGEAQAHRPARRWRSMPRWPSASACTSSRTSSRTWPSAS